jgi:hypothetical protein
METSFQFMKPILCNWFPLCMTRLSNALERIWKEAVVPSRHFSGGTEKTTKKLENLPNTKREC